MKCKNSVNTVLASLLIISANIFADDVTDGMNALSEQNYTKANMHFSKACSVENGRWSSFGCDALAGAYEFGFGTPKNMTKAVEFYTKACNLGSPKACESLGRIYVHGEEEIQKDFVNGAKFSTKACDGGSLKGCVIIGIMYAKGWGIQADNIKAKYYFDKACDGGFGGGCHALGAAYADGLPQDKEKAKFYFGKACDLNFEDGCKAYAHFNNGGQ